MQTMLRLVVVATLHWLGRANDDGSCAAGADDCVGSACPVGGCRDEEQIEPLELGDAELGDAALAVRESTINGAGKGTFARRSFAKGEVVGQYHCRVEQYNVLDTTFSAAYSWKVNATHRCVAEQTHKNPCRYVNSVSALESCTRQNVAVVGDDMSSGVFYGATRDIAIGEELLVD